MQVPYPIFFSIKNFLLLRPKNLQDPLRFFCKPGYILRKILFDRDKPWRFILQQGQIMGIYSNSKLNPIKKKGFAPEFEGYGEAQAYEEWRFYYAPGSAAIAAPAS